MSTISKELFEELKQRTVNCVNEPNYESIESLRQFVIKCDHNFINSLYQYSIFPLRLIIANLPKNQNNCEKILESSVECLSVILQKSRIKQFDIFADIFANLFHLIDDNRYTISDNEFTFKPNEDLILSVIKCSKSLIQSCDECLVTQVVSPAFSAQLGHSIHILLNTANNQKYGLIKAEAIETIDYLISKCQLSLTQDCLKWSPQDLMAYFLPGISINVSKLISSDDKLNRRAISSSLTLLSNTIVFVFNDISINSEIDSKIIESKQISNDSEVSENNRFFIIRDQKWLENTCDKLIIIFEKIISNLISHQNWNVRQSLAQFVTKILTNCSPLFITRCLSSLIVVPLSYLSDDFEQIRHESDSFVTKFAKTYTTSDSSKSYMDLIEDQIYLYITRLPRLIRTVSEREKITSIYLLFGYLKCLDTNGINYLVYSPQHKHKLFECLIDISAFDYHGIQLLEHVTHSTTISQLSEEQMPQKWIRKNFSYINDENSMTALTKCCQIIGERVDSQVLVDYLMDALRQSKLNPSVVFVANHIISNISANYSEVEELLEIYLTNICISLEDKTIEQMNKDILRQCLLIEGLTAFLHFYDSESSANYLLKCIFPLLECVGASNQSLFQTSYRALTLVSQHFRYNSISKLIDNNIDYLINSISINLKHFIDNQRVPIVIKVMLRYSTQDMVHLFDGVIEEIIVVTDRYHRTQPLPLLEVLYCFVSTINYYFGTNSQLLNSDKHIDNNDCNERTSFGDKTQHFIRRFEEFMGNKNISQDFENENQLISDIEEESDSNGDIDKKNDPFFVQLIEKIMERCVHLMSSPESKVRLIVLDIVIQSLHVLKPFEDHLLPMAHKLWSPLVDRFADKDIIVIKRSFSCLQIMSKTCGDFIRVRTVKEVFPKMLSFLKCQSQISFKKDKASAYRFTIAYQFQIDILCGIGSIAIDLDLRDKELWELIVGIMPYLHSSQPKPLQESAVYGLKKISELDANSVFYFLKMTFSSNETISQNENKIFPDLRFGENKKEFENNVKSLLDYLSLN